MKLITSGCSFTETLYNKTWPAWLSDFLKAELINTGLGSQGNGLIAKKLIYNLSQLKSYDDVLVGVMWSGTDRGEQFTTNRKVKQTFQRRNVDGWQTNPSIFPANSAGAWIIHNVHWANIYSCDFYKNHDDIGAQINTLTDILYIQSFLKSNNIRYFMSNYTQKTFLEDLGPDTEYLYNLIDFDYWLPVDGCHEWCRDNTTIPFCDDGWHPSRDQHKLFTEQVILPFIKDKYKIDRIN